MSEYVSKQKFKSKYASFLLKNCENRLALGLCLQTHVCLRRLGASLSDPFINLF